MEHCPDCQVPVGHMDDYVCSECGLNLKQLEAISLAVTSKFFSLLVIVAANHNIALSQDIKDAMLLIAKSRELREGIEVLRDLIPEQIQAVEDILKWS